jgi:hypothetical protein
LPNAVSFAMQIRADHLIRKIIRSICRIAFFVGFFSKARIANLDEKLCESFIALNSISYQKNVDLTV